MTDSLHIAAPAVETDSTFHHVKVVEHLVFEEPDSVMGSYFVVQPSPLSLHVQHVEIETVHIPLPKDTTFLNSFTTLWNPEIKDFMSRHEEVAWTPTGIAGDPTDYQFRNDDFVTSLILMSFFLMMWVIASSWKFLRGHFKDFFYTRERPNLFAEREDTVLRGRLLLIAQTCFLVAILFFTVTQIYLPDVFAQVSPYVLLCSATLVSMVYYLLKLGIYSIVNHTFFSPAKCKLWSDTYLTSVLTTGCCLLPITLLAVFLDMPFFYTALAVILLLSVIKIMLLYKCLRIFFRTKLGGVHIILYFCALEIVPLGLFAASLVIMSSHLPTT